MNDQALAYCHCPLFVEALNNASVGITLHSQYFWLGPMSLLYCPFCGCNLPNGLDFEIPFLSEEESADLVKLISDVETKPQAIEKLGMPCDCIQKYRWFDGKTLREGDVFQYFNISPNYDITLTFGDSLVRKEVIPKPLQGEWNRRGDAKTLH